MLGRRPDGYHLLDSVVVFAGVHDVIHATPAPHWSLEVVGPWRDQLDPGPANLVLRAATALAEASGGPPMRLVLEKNLPIASGIGGGSADAAATLRLLSRLWEAPTAGRARGHSTALALPLGADVPVCLAGQPARMGGIGEILAPAPALPRFGIALVNPGIAVPTGAVFAARSGGWSQPAVLPDSWASLSDMVACLIGARNDLEEAGGRMVPVIREVVAALATSPGCRLARMSGSGATCFGLFDDAAAAERAASGLRRPGWWCWGGAPA